MKYCGSHKLEKKFNNLKRKFEIPKSNDDIYNLQISPSGLELACGLRFCLPPKDLDIYDVNCPGRGARGTPF